MSDPVTAKRRCDALRDEFEEAWLQRQRPSVSGFLARVPEIERANLLRELVAVDAAYRREPGESPQAEDYQLDGDASAKIVREALVLHDASPGWSASARAPIATICGHSARPGGRRQLTRGIRRRRKLRRKTTIHTRRLPLGLAQVTGSGGLTGCGKTCSRARETGGAKLAHAVPPADVWRVT